MADYVVRLTGEDNLSGTIKKVKDELNKVGETTSLIDKITDKFNKIANSAAPLKRKLRDIENIMAKMNLDGLNDTDIFYKMAAEAANYKDALGDAALASRLLSSDTANLDAGILAFLGLAAAASITSGVMGLLGSKNEEVEKALLKVQSAIAILNGALAIGNILNKDSILMLKLKLIALASNTSTTVAASAATAVNTAVTTANTAATTGSTLVLNAWNVAKAVAKALLGDFSGLLIVGVAALGAYALATSDSTEEEEASAKSKEKVTTAFENEILTAAKATALLYTHIATLKNFSGSKADEKKLVDELNNTYGESMGYYDSVSKWYDTLIKNSEDYCKQLIIEAKTRALASELEKSFEREYKVSHDENGNKRLRVVDNGNQKERYTVLNPATGKEIVIHGNKKKLISGDELPEVLKEKQIQKNLANEIASLQSLKNSLIKHLGGGRGKTNKTITPSKITPSNTATTKSEAKYDSSTSTLLGMNNNVEVLQKKLKSLDINSSEFKDVSLEIEVWKERIESVNKKFETGSISDYLNQISLLDDTLKNMNLSELKRNELLSLRESLLKKVESLLGKDKKDYLKGSIADIRDLIKLIEKSLDNDNLDISSRIKLETSRDELLKLIDDITDRSLIKINNIDSTKLDARYNAESNVLNVLLRYSAGIIDVDAARAEIESINLQLQLIGLKPIQIHLESNAEVTLKNITGLIDNMGNTLSSIGKDFEIPALDTAGIMAGAIATMILSYATVLALSAALGPIAWLGFGLTGLALLGAIVASVKNMGSYANGGIIAGGSSNGDFLTARVNAGEMILNGTQLKRLFNLLDSGGAIGNKGGEVTFKILGSTLKGVLNNYDNKISKVR